MMRLHWFWSTNPQKIRFALEELSLPYELIPVDLVKGEHQTPEFQAVSPRSRVPVLEIDGVTLWESDGILLYLGQREERHWPKEPQGRAMAFNLLFMEASAFQDQASVYFFNRVVLAQIGKAGDEQRIARAAGKIAPLLVLLSKQLGEQDYLLGAFSLVDCAYAPWLPVLDLEAYPNLMEWRMRLQSRPAWTRCEFPY
jgi:glutathione S-transferase